MPPKKKKTVKGKTGSSGTPEPSTPLTLDEAQRIIALCDFRHPRLQEAIAVAGSSKRNRRPMRWRGYDDEHGKHSDSSDEEASTDQEESTKKPVPKKNAKRADPSSSPAAATPTIPVAGGGATTSKSPRPPSTLGKRQRVVVVDSDTSDVHSTDDERDVPPGDDPSPAPMVTASPAPARTTSVNAPSGASPTNDLPPSFYDNQDPRTPATPAVGAPEPKRSRGRTRVSGNAAPPTPTGTAGRPRGSPTVAASPTLGANPNWVKKQVARLPASPSPFTATKTNCQMSVQTNDDFAAKVHFLTGKNTFEKEREVYTDWVILYSGEMIFEGLTQKLKATRQDDLRRTNARSRGARRTLEQLPPPRDILNRTFWSYMCEKDKCTMEQATPKELVLLTLSGITSTTSTPTCFRVDVGSSWRYQGDDVVFDNFVS